MTALPPKAEVHPLVDRPPRDLFHLEAIGVENSLCLCDELFDGDIAACNPLADFEVPELDIEADEVPALARDDEHAALMGGLDQALAADVREIGNRQEVHHAPSVVRR